MGVLLVFLVTFAQRGKCALRWRVKHHLAGEPLHAADHFLRRIRPHGSVVPASGIRVGPDRVQERVGVSERREVLQGGGEFPFDP